ncbi:DUF533 domain-containing protein [Litorisediminicola beolgyonensis]|uniref:DUF533 domain-containing protein n=1 Tax=Litorisediminicola beolgyonensis TaxID=1173614 RepID=A0ABW3ZGH5_9RHOB
MSLMKTLTKVAIGYAVARGVDRMASGKGLSGLFGGSAQVKGRHPATKAGTQMTGAAQAGMQQATQPFQSMIDQLQEFGRNMGGAMGGGLGGRSGGGLLSSVPSGGTGMAGLAAAAGGAATMGGQGIGALIDRFNTEATAPEMEKSAGLLLRAMIQAAKSDGEIDDEERAKLLELVGDDASEADIAFVSEQLSAPVDPDALASDTPEQMRLPVYSSALMAIRVDTDAEAQFLDRLAQGLGLDEPTVNAVHLQMGQKPLYV